MLKSVKKVLAIGTHTIDATLVGVDGYTGQGAIEYSKMPSGHRRYTIDLRGIAGKAAELYVDGIRVAQVTIDNGRAHKCFDTRHGDSAPALLRDDLLEVRQNGHIILEGVLGVS